MMTAGWKEYADFPGLGLRRVKVKLDTGARSASIGVRHYRVFDTPSGPEAEFEIAPYRRHPGRVKIVRLPVVGFVSVKSSSGEADRRPVVELIVCLGPVTKTIRATVADRSRMLVPVLLGRRCLSPEFVVDPSRKFVLSKQRD